MIKKLIAAYREWRAVMMDHDAERGKAKESMSSRFRKPDQIIHPWQFGHNAEKQTCLWLKGLPKLIPETTEKPKLEYFEWIDSRTGKKKRMEKWMYDIRCISDRQKRANAASKTFIGIAKAMAQQWAGEAQ